MILTDFSAVGIAATINSAMRERISLDDQVVKHIVFSTFRNIHKALGPQYGRHILLCDSRSWRKDVYTYYKANRTKKDTDIDWEMIFRVMEEIKTAFDKHFPFDVITVDGCEGDDIIAAFAKQATEPTVIVSKDHDFFQLNNSLVKQWDFSKKKYITVEDADVAWVDIVIRGCAGDGVPNIMSDDDTFVSKDKKQPMMTAQRLDYFKELAENDFEDAPKEYIIRKEKKGTKKNPLTEPAIVCYDLKKNWERNKLLVDLRSPVKIARDAVDKYNTTPQKNISQNDTANYLANQKMVALLGKISDFYKGSKNNQEQGPLSQFM